MPTAAHTPVPDFIHCLSSFLTRSVAVLSSGCANRKAVGRCLHLPSFSCAVITMQSCSLQLSAENINYLLCFIYLFIEPLYALLIFCVDYNVSLHSQQRPTLGTKFIQLD